MNMIWISRLAVVALLGGAAGVGAAQDTLPDEVTQGKTVTVAKIRANSEKVFDAIAGAGQSSITRSAFVSNVLQQKIATGSPDHDLLSRLFPLLDANGDGVLTRSEFGRRIDSEIGFADENGDGTISLTELANAKRNMGVFDALGMAF